MRWSPGGTSRNIEDRRGGGGFGAPAGIGGVVLLILSLVFGRDLVTGSGDDGGTGGYSQAPGDVAPVNETDEEKKLVQFVSVVLDSAQTTWARILPGYRDAKLVLFRDATQTGCGVGQSAMGPFYCPMDEKVYIDLGFYDQLRERFGADGDFAQAYVIAHELGHHVQHLVGTEQEVREAQRLDRSSANQYSVALELQADCYAGVWGYHAGKVGMLDPGDMEEGINAASAVGDDRIQAATRGRVSPESFTHGSARQRSEWFRRGMQSGDPKACNTLR